MSRRFRRGATAGCAAAVVLGFLGHFIRLNTSASLPRGIYILGNHPPERGDLILFCPPPTAARFAAERQYLPHGSCLGPVEPMGKILLAAPGDLLELTAGGMAINGRQLSRSRPRGLDAANRPIHHFPYGRYTVGRGDLWVFAPHPLSFDSRYFGPVAAERLLGTLSPVWTFPRTALERAAHLIRSSSRKS